MRAGQTLFFAGETLGLAGEVLPSAPPTIGIEITREPVGIITRSSLPITIPARKVAPALFIL